LIQGVAFKGGFITVLVLVFLAAFGSVTRTAGTPEKRNVAAQAASETIRPFTFHASDEDLADLRRSWAEKAYPKLIHDGALPQGGHFAAWEQPELFVAELRESFRSLR